MAKTPIKQLLNESLRTAERTVAWAINSESLPYWQRPRLEAVLSSIRLFISDIDANLPSDLTGILESGIEAARRLGIDGESVVQRARRMQLKPLTWNGKTALFDPSQLAAGRSQQKRKRGSRRRKRGA